MPSIVRSDAAFRTPRTLGDPVHVAIVVLYSILLAHLYLIFDHWALVLGPDLLVGHRYRVLALTSPPVATRNTTTAIGLSVPVSFRPLTAAARRSGWIEDLC